MVVTNPPYIKTRWVLNGVLQTLLRMTVPSDIRDLDTGVREYEPETALDGGESGLRAYEQVVRALPPFLRRNSFVCMEVGQNMHLDVCGATPHRKRVLTPF